MLAYRLPNGKSFSVDAGTGDTGLDGLVQDLAGHARGDDLDHRDLRARRLIADRIHHVSGLQLSAASPARSCNAHRRSARAIPSDRLWVCRKATRDCTRAQSSASARSATPMVRMQWRMRPGPRRPCATSKPRPSPSSRLAAAHVHVAQFDFHVSVRSVSVIAKDAERTDCTSMPGVFDGTRIIDCCSCLLACVSPGLRGCIGRSADHRRRKQTICGR